MKKLSLTKPFVMAGLLAITVQLQAQDTTLFHANFDTNANANVLVGGDTGVLSRAQITTAKAGKEGEGAFVASNKLGDFVDAFGGATPRVGRALKYPIGNVINPAAGTIEMWVKPYFNGESANARFISYYLFDAGNIDTEKRDRSGGIQMLIHETGLDVGESKKAVQVFFNSADGKLLQLAHPITWEPRTWHHVALTWDETSVTLWIDNAKADSKPSPGAPKAPDNFFVLGGSWNEGRRIQGLLDEVKISNTVQYK